MSDSTALAAKIARMTKELEAAMKREEATKAEAEELDRVKAEAEEAQRRYKAALAVRRQLMADEAAEECELAKRRQVASKEGK